MNKPNVFSRRMVKPEDLNPSGSLFGGRMLQWIDEEAAIFCMCRLETKSLVTAHMGSINFKASAFLGDVVEFESSVIGYGTTSITTSMTVRNKFTREVICEIEKLVFVAVDPQNRKPMPHGKTMEHEQKFING